MYRREVLSSYIKCWNQVYYLKSPSILKFSEKRVSSVRRFREKVYFGQNWRSVLWKLNVEMVDKVVSCEAETYNNLHDKCF